MADTTTTTKTLFGGGASGTIIGLTDHTDMKLTLNTREDICVCGGGGTDLGVGGEKGGGGREGGRREEGSEEESLGMMPGL